jgi:hypothetical protein
MLGPGKKTRDWQKARKQLKEEYQGKDITWCEAGLRNCWGNNGLSFHHRYKRRDDRCEHTFEGTILVCVNCHNKLEYDRDLNKRVFEKLRT